MCVCVCVCLYVYWIQENICISRLLNSAPFLSLRATIVPIYSPAAYVWNHFWKTDLNCTQLTQTQLITPAKEMPCPPPSNLSFSISLSLSLSLSLWLFRDLLILSSPHWPRLVPVPRPTSPAPLSQHPLPYVVLLVPAVPKIVVDCLLET